jgi:hypothetical protein
MPLAEDNDMVEAITSDRADEPLRISILPGQVWRDRPIPNAHRPHALNESGTVNTVPITDHVSRRIPPAKRLGDLLRNPFGGRMRGHSQPQKLPTTMQQDSRRFRVLRFRLMFSPKQACR